MAARSEKSRIAWGLTGAGHFLPEITELVDTIDEVDLFVSRAANEVLKKYHLEKVLSCGERVFYDRTASSSVVNKLYLGYYRLVVVAPATSNSVAKFVHGISDSLVTNLFAHAGKARVPVIVLPSDVTSELDSRAPGGMVHVYPRQIDLENTNSLESFAGTTVVKNSQELEECLNTYL